MSSTSTQQSPAEARRFPGRPSPRGPRLSGGSWRQWLVSPGRERTCLIVLGLVSILAIAVGLNETHGATFSPDEYWYFIVNRGFDIKGLLSPHNGNLTAVIRLLYATVFKLVGPDYTVFRVLEFLEVALTGALFYALARRRVAPVAALALTLPLLFLGSSPDVAISTIGVQHLLCLILSLGALLALERDSRGGDVAACVLLTLAVATFSIAFAFIAGVAVMVLQREDRWRRAWIFLIPIVIYVLWLVAAPKYSGPGYLGPNHVRAANALLIPSFIGRSAAAVVAGVSGLGYDFVQSRPSSVLTDYSWAIPLAIAGFVALGWRARRAPVDRWFWSYLAIPLAFWVSIVMTLEANRYPNSQRYIYGGAVAVLLLIAEALRGVRWSARALAVILGLGVAATLGNAGQLRVDGSIARASGARFRAVLTSIELARGHVAANFLPPDAPNIGVVILWGGGVKPYFEAVHRNGSFAFSVPALRRQPESVRELADSTLVSALRIHLRASPGFKGTQGCAPPPTRGRRLTLRAPGIALRSAAGGAVMLGRFSSSPTVQVGSLLPGRFYELAIPQDRSSLPWKVSVPRGIRSVCALTSAPRL